MIRCGNWEPVDTAEAINLIKDKFERKEKLVYVNGWSCDWPIATDETRKDMLRQFGHVLKDYSENDIMPRSVWDWLMVYAEENVKLPEVPGDYLEKCKFFKSPQCLCFLEEKNIEYLLEYVRELSTDLRTGLVSKVVDGLWVKSLVKERIDIQRVGFNLLLDERLLFEGEHRDYDDVGTVKTFKSSGIYDHVIPKGDEIVSWLLDCPPIDAEFVSQVAEGTQNLEIWLAALRIVRSTARKEESYYTKRDKLLTYDKIVVKDILEGAATPRFGELDDKEFTDGTSELFTTVQNDAVRRNLWKLRNSLNNKVVISIDAKILLNEWTYKKLHEFARLSVIENRLVVIPFVKLYLQDKLKSMLKTHKRKITTESDHIKALEITEKTISDHGLKKSCSPHHQLQGDIFFSLARKADTTDIKCVYLFASVDAYSMSSLLCPDSVSSFYGCARSLIELGDQLGINSFYKKAESKARHGLSVKMLKPQESSHQFIEDDLKAELEDLINLATLKMNISEAMLVKINVANQMQGQCKVDTYVIDRLKNLWGKLDEKTKREFLVVDRTSLIDYLRDNMYDKKMIEHISKCLRVDDELGWRWWKCRICPQVNYCFTDCKWHILDKHVHEFLPRICSRPKRVDKFLADMICCGNWEPVDTSRAVDLIKARIKGREEFIYVNGWCNDWPVAKDEERKEILRQFAEVLKSSCSNDTLPCSLWDWLIDYTEENVNLPQVHGFYLDSWSFFKNPQCICFLDLKSLKYILEYVKQFTTDVRTGLVLAVVDRLGAKSLVNERIDLERGGLNLLLDERLLYEGEHGFDDLGTVRTFKSTEIYEHVIPKGDEIVSWVLDCPAIDTNFVSQVAEGVHNLEIWLAVLRIVRSTARKEVSYYSKRDKLQTYAKMLGEAEALCDKEDKWRNVYQRRRYALTFRSVCERRVTQDNATKCCFLNVVRDVLQEAESPRFEVLQDKEFMECISELSTTVQNDVIRRSMCRLRKWLNEKLVLIDSKILLNEWTYKRLLEFAKLSAIDNRLVVLPLVKMFLQNKLKSTIETHKRKITTADAGASAKRRSTQTR
ncbi:unnamed protein product [Brassica oleracea var. botrytis]